MKVRILQETSFRCEVGSIADDGRVSVSSHKFNLKPGEVVDLPPYKAAELINHQGESGPQPIAEPVEG
jgi:hypothetical protein